MLIMSHYNLETGLENISNIFRLCGVHNGAWANFVCWKCPVLGLSLLPVARNLHLNAYTQLFSSTLPDPSTAFAQKFPQPTTPFKT